MDDSRKFKHLWLSWGVRLLPFTDAVSEDLPLSRLLRLSLFQISVGMALVLLVGTLNRVMIVELGVPTSLVAVMVAMPLCFAPFRALVGFRSDHHRSQLGWRRVPYIWMGTLLQFGGFSVMPFALLVLAGLGESSQAPVWVGQMASAVAFLLVGAGLHTTQTAGLALATDLTPPHKQANVVGFMYVMMLVGMLGSALLFGDLLTEFTPGRLVQVIQAAALITLVLNTVAMWKQESRSRSRRPGQGADPSFAEAWALFTRDADAVRRLWVVSLGSLDGGGTGETRNHHRNSMSRRLGRESTPNRRETEGEVRNRRQGNHASGPEMAIRPPGATPTGESSERTKGNNQRSRTGGFSNGRRPERSAGKPAAPSGLSCVCDRVRQRTDERTTHLGKVRA